MEDLQTQLETVAQQLDAVVTAMDSVMVGQHQVLRHALAACVAGGHVLFEDVPGTGKTTLASSLARVLNLKFTRVQGTPDLLPSDLVGTMVFRPEKGEFEFRPGPVFTQVLLMDEINRATPRMQSALLEAMSERQVTVDGQTQRLEQPFFVMATANPLESQGVFPLPEAQLDRFLVQLRLGYVSYEDELELVRRIRLTEPTELAPMLERSTLESAGRLVRQIHVEKELIEYIVKLCRATREHPDITLGASPRAVLYLTSFSQALALLAGRSYVLPDDIVEAWHPVMNHRVVTTIGWSPLDKGANRKADTLLAQVLGQVPVPTEIQYEETR